MVQTHWWQTGVFYQIYPRSFSDYNGDGIGDIRGMIDRLDYLQELGIDAIWLSPHYPSPQFDCGYDISDFCGVAPEYGTLAEFSEFLKAAHNRRIRVILDLVLNHCSHQHPWFIDARSSRHSPKRDWFIWHDRKDGGFPNNWNSTFDGEAWEWDPATSQYYYHFFFKQQPDLNWRNPEVKAAMWQAVRFWLDMGVDGFRLDALGTIFEDPSLRNHPVHYSLLDMRRLPRQAKTPQQASEFGKLWREMFQYQVEQPGIHELMQELRSVVNEYGDILLVGENEDISYHGNGENELQLVFNFPLMRTERLTPDWVRENQSDRLRKLASVSGTAWPCNTLGNHDSPRLKNHFGDGKHDTELAKQSLALMLTLPGTPFLYYGEEIGMTDYQLSDIKDFRDTMGTWQYHAEIETFHTSPSEALASAAAISRDKSRTPMQWGNSANAGFCPPDTRPWLPVNPNYAERINVLDQMDDSSSMLSYYRRLLQFRKFSPALQSGGYKPILENSKSIYAFLRDTGEDTMLIMMNMTEQTRRIESVHRGLVTECQFSTHTRPTGQIDLRGLQLYPFEVFIGTLR